MSIELSTDIVVIGGGIVGMATALELAGRRRRVAVVEAEDRLAAHQTGRNSGVIHSGLYYKPGSLKALNCAAGREEMYEFCAAHRVPFERCGKIVIATRPGEIPALEELERRGHANGLEGMKRLTPAKIRGIEPEAAGVDGLYVPQTGIVDYAAVVAAMASDFEAAGGRIVTGFRVAHATPERGGYVLHATAGKVFARNLVNCAGLQSDRVAELCGVDPGLQIVPFRGEYYTLRPERSGLVRHLIYPVPDPRFPFLGVHFTRRVDGRVEAGPNAVLAFRREGYTRTSFSFGDSYDLLTYGGFWRMAAKHAGMGLGEMYRSLNRRAFTRALQRLLPAIRPEDLAPGGAGVRAQAVERNGALTDDFRIVEGERMVHVLNAPSPAATASLAIARSIADTAEKRFE